jgi:gliding motility-associated protein GldC
MSDKKSKIVLEVGLSNDNMPEQIMWSASNSEVSTPQESRAMLLGLWDYKERSALRIDLWTTEMRMDEMNDFFYQSFLGMADTYGRANKNTEMVDFIKQFAQEFHKKAINAVEGNIENKENN